MKVNKSGDSLICFNLLSLFEEFFAVFFFGGGLPKSVPCSQPCGQMGDS